MRLIDIYKETASGVTLVTAGCIQTGSTALKRTVQSKFYTMADGTTRCYPIPTAKASMTLTLECTRLQAASIDAVTLLGSLVFAGLRFGTNFGSDAGLTAADQLYPTGYRAFLTGDVQIDEVFARSGIYSVTLPLVLSASGAIFEQPSVPALSPVSLALDGTVVSPKAFRMELRNIGGARRPVLVRRSVLLTRSDTLGISLTLNRTDSGSLTGLTAAVTGAETSVVINGMSAEISGAAALSPGENLVTVQCHLGGCRSLLLCIPVYRQAVSA